MMAAYTFITGYVCVYHYQKKKKKSIRELKALAVMLFDSLV
jgi:hypothetical protein